MRTVWKFKLSSARTQVVMMPRGAEILWLEMVQDLPTMWAMVQDSAPIVRRTIAWWGTGETLDDWITSDAFIATTIRHGGRAVGHFFDLGES